MLSTLLFLASAHASLSGVYDVPKNTTSLQLSSVEGDVTVRVDPGLHAPVIEATDRRPGRVCKLEVIKDRRGKTEVRFGPKDQEDPRDCRADFTVSLPVGMAFQVDLGVGKVEAAGMSASLQVAVKRGEVALVDHSGFASLAIANGDVSLSGVSGTTVVDVAKGRLHGDPSGPVKARVGEGGISLKNLFQAIEADTGVGDILLAYAAMPTDALMLNAGHGHVVVDLPNGQAIQPRMSSMTGSTTCELPTGEGIEVFAVSGMGSVRLY